MWNNKRVWSLVNADIVGGIVPERKIGGRGRKGAEVRADHIAICDHFPGKMIQLILNLILNLKEEVRTTQRRLVQL